MPSHHTLESRPVRGMKPMMRMMKMKAVMRKKMLTMKRMRRRRMTIECAGGNLPGEDGAYFNLFPKYVQSLSSSAPIANVAQVYLRSSIGKCK